MQDNQLDTLLKQRYSAAPRANLADDIIANTQDNNQKTADTVGFFMFRPRYTYAMFGLVIIAAIALLASFPETYMTNTSDAYNDISTYMVYETLADFGDVS